MFANSTFNQIVQDYNNSIRKRKDTCYYDCYSFQKFSDVYDTFHKPLTLTICIFGVSANGVNLIVLTRRGMINIMNILLTGLTAAQFCLLLNYLFLLLYNFLAENCYVTSKFHRPSIDNVALL